jgi:hypothetical protein
MEGMLGACLCDAVRSLPCDVGWHYGVAGANDDMSRFGRYALVAALPQAHTPIKMHNANMERIAFLRSVCPVVTWCPG